MLYIVRVWNPADKKLELMKEFEEEPLCLSVHPSGVYLAVAFPDRVKILSLLLEEIALVREIPTRSVRSFNTFFSSCNKAVIV